ncbi:hypothetical protein GE21DRAFT_5770 [Neurospora crassa]|uniref:SigF-like NTF2-like domain-containing protein n=1 Tax=Neurospora crassa (strain ATCC 24698 / 74-OR23-1A / CBS 708.71 / DSM 1257 / FGSC 987) TaxID=367110 RepID=Q7S9N8_NEUCR|nr:hypothetical protein NCU07661 [Neurospora crassa OR74A]EAA33067.1 hypothetical protein NCU07661 [Neurospora crassa OR74A]KHE84729.1 hypothetical protein GE21DRAFT_5770 [Neurospora crassa]|eukprot:XP_962303.1 hypothetical protein NCU07661 [Neurospora crassa OR74A]
MEHPVKDIRRVIGTLCQGSPQEQEDTLSRYFTPSASFVHPFCRVPHFDNIYIPRYGLLNSREIIQYIYKWYKILSPKIDIEVESAVFDQKSSLLYVNVAQTFTIWFLPFHKAPVRLVTVLHLVPEDEFNNNHNKSRNPRRRLLSENNNALAKQQVTDNDSDHSSSLEGPSYASVAAGDATPEKTEEGIPMAHPPNPSNPVAVENAPVASARASEEAETLVDGFNGGNNSKRYLITKQEDFYQVNDWLKFVFSSPGAWVWYAIQVWNSILCVVGVVLFEPLIRAIGIRREGGGKPKWT